MRLLFEFDPDRCSACGACAVACMDQNDIAVEEGQRSYRTVHTYEHGGALTSVSMACMHCEDAPCIPVCPMHCLYKDADTGLTMVDDTDCVGCRLCLRACPYGAPTFRPTGIAHPKEKMEKCHGCLERIRAGYAPACVHACPTGALTWRWADTGDRDP